MPRTREKELVHRTLNGDKNAFSSLYRTHRARIYAAVRGRARDPDDVEDLVQATFIRAYQGLAGYRGEAAFSTWLTQIALNLCVSHARSEKALASRVDAVAGPDPGLRELWEPAPGEDPEDALHRKERRELILRHLRDLPAPYREALRLRYLEDRSYLEITKALGVPIGTVKSWLHRARRQLEETVQDTDLVHP